MAERLRVATYHAGLSRKGPGLMMRDVLKGEEQATAALDTIVAAAPDVVLLLDVDWDAGGAALDAVADALAERGVDYPYRLAPRPNSGRPSGFDLDGDGRTHRARDALGYGRFTGDGGLALLSRHPLGAPRDLSDILWADRDDVTGLLPEGAGAVVPLATIGQWVVPLEVGGTRLTLITLAAGTPVFDGPEDRNGRRNAAELALVAELVSEVDHPVVLGRANVDPVDGEGDRDALAALLDHPALRDPEPRGAGGGGDGHAGDPALDTVDWEGPGPLRVDYVLPARDLAVTAAGVDWPDPDDPRREIVETAGSGRLVWVDLTLP